MRRLPIGAAFIVSQAPVCQATTTLSIDEMSPKIAPVQEILPSQTAPDFYLTQYQICSTFISNTDI